MAVLWNRIGLFVSWGALTIAFAAIGLGLDARRGFLDESGAYLSARAILTAKEPLGDPKSLILVNPPLAHLAVIPFAAARFTHPSIWVSSAVMAAMVFFMARILRRAKRQVPFAPIAIVLMLVQAPVVFGAVSGAPDAVFAVSLTMATMLMARYILERERLDDYARTGRIRHDLKRYVVMDLRLSDLWGSALWLALATLARPDFGVFSLLYLVAVPFLVPSEERKDFKRLFTLALLLLLPVFTGLATWSYMGWIFDGDFGVVFSNPEFNALHSGPELLFDPAAESWRGRPWGALLGVVTMALVVASALPVVLVLLRSPGVTCLFIPVAAMLCWQAISGSRPPGMIDFLPVTLSAVGLAFLGAAVGRVKNGSWKFAVLAIGVMTLGGWFGFSTSHRATERDFVRSLFGQEVGNHRGERNMLDLLRLQTEVRPILLDDSSGFLFVALAGWDFPFVTPHDKLFYQALANYPRLGYLVLYDDASKDRMRRDLVHHHYLEVLQGDGSRFIPLLRSDSWTLGVADSLDHIAPKRSNAEIQ